MSDSSVMRDKHIKLRDGRALGYAEFGVPTGRPIFLFSGTSSRWFYPVEGSVVWDMRILTGPWGFSPAAIQVKTHLWQGEQDVNVPLPMGKYLARTIPNCQARFLSNEGHLMTLNHWPEIVSTLVALIWINAYVNHALGRVGPEVPAWLSFALFFSLDGSLA